MSIAGAVIKPVTHCVFDVDGLLLDTETVWTQILRRIVEPYGKDFTWDFQLSLMGKTENECSRIIIDYFNLPLTVEEYIEQSDKLQAEMIPSAGILPGVEKLVNHLYNKRVPIAIATGSSASEFSLKEKSHSQFFSVFHHKVFSGSDPDVINGKPAPDCFLLAAKRFPDSPDPSKVLVFEDSPNGVQGALNAGMQVVWIPDPKVDKSVCKDKATVTLNSMLEFRPELFGLPPYD